MNKMKKIISSIGVFIIGIISKVYAIGPDTIVSMYAVDPGPVKKIPSIVATISKIGKVAVPIILFVIGLFVVFSKKTTNKIKVVVVLTLTILAIISVILMNYFSTMF